MQAQSRNTMLPASESLRFGQKIKIKIKTMKPDNSSSGDVDLFMADGGGKYSFDSSDNSKKRKKLSDLRRAITDLIYPTKSSEAHTSGKEDRSQTKSDPDRHHYSGECPLRLGKVIK